MNSKMSIFQSDEVIKVSRSINILDNKNSQKSRHFALNAHSQVGLSQPLLETILPRGDR